MHLNHPAGGDQHGKDAGSVFIAHPLWTWEGAGLVIDSIALGTEFTSCLEGHSALGSAVLCFGHRPHTPMALQTGL